MFVKEVVHREGNHIENRINELGFTSFDQFRMAEWSVAYAHIFYFSDGLVFVESENAEATGIKGKWMKAERATEKPPFNQALAGALGKK